MIWKILLGWAVTLSVFYAIFFGIIKGRKERNR